MIETLANFSELSSKIMRDESKYILDEKKPAFNYEDQTASPKVHRIPRNEVGSGYQAQPLPTSQVESRGGQMRDQQITPSRGQFSRDEVDASQ